jgi:GAF domain-containing protein
MPHVGEPAQSWLGVPLMIGDQITGVMAVQDYKTPNVYDEHDRDMLIAVGAQAAIAIQNARLFEETQHSLAETRSLYEASRQIETSRDLQDMVTAVAEGFSAPGIQWAALLTFERDETDQVQAVQVQGTWHSDSKIAPLPMGTRFSKEMFATSGLILSDAPTFFDDTQNDQRIDPALAAVLSRRNMHTLAVLPLASGKTQTGILMLAGQAPRHFAERERQAYATLVGQMAVVMENRRLLQDAEARARREQVLREITARVRGSTDPDTIVRTAVRGLGAVLGRPAFIRLGSQEQLSRTPGNGNRQTQKGGE